MNCCEGVRKKLNDMFSLGRLARRRKDLEYLSTRYWLSSRRWTTSSRKHWEFGHHQWSSRQMVSSRSATRRENVSWLGSCYAFKNRSLMNYYLLQFNKTWSIMVKTSFFTEVNRFPCNNCHHRRHRGWSVEHFQSRRWRYDERGRDLRTAYRAKRKVTACNKYVAGYTLFGEHRQQDEG